MKKSVLALALFGAFAGAASAQTSVTIYGIVDAGIVHEDRGDPALTATGASDPTKPGGTTTRLDSGLQSGSRIGFKGTEDLGDGLSAIFTLENGFNTDAGTLGQGGRLFGRQAWVGLQSKDIGTVKLGRQKTLMRDAIESIDPFELGMTGSMDRFFYDNGTGFRVDNAATYSLPTNLGGFYGNVMYVFGEQVNDTSSLRQIGLSGGYVNGPINITLAYQNVNNPTKLAVTAFPSSISAALAAQLATTTIDGSNKTTLLGGSYDFGVVKVHAAYAWNKWDISGSGAAGSFSGNAEDSRNAMLGLTAPFGPHKILASYIHHKNELGADRDWNAINLAYTYSFSKRTNVYTSWGRTSFDSLATNTGTNGNPVSVDRPGDNNTVFEFGIRHKF